MYPVFSPFPRLKDRSHKRHNSLFLFLPINETESFCISYSNTPSSSEVDKASIHSAAENFALTIQTLRSKIPLERPAKDRNFARAKDSTDVFPAPAPNYGLLPKDGTSVLSI
jgi:hypothetical protein